MSLTKIVRCNCKNEYQDEQYGAGKRVGNKLGGKKTGDSFRCSSCASENVVVIQP